MNGEGAEGGVEPAQAGDGAEPRRWRRWAVSILLTLLALLIVLQTPPAPGQPAGPLFPPLPPGRVFPFPAAIVRQWLVLLCGLRLFGLALAPGGAPWPFLSRPPWTHLSRARALRPYPTSLPFPELTPWRSVSPRVDLPIALGLFLFTAWARAWGTHWINPEGLPFGPDWHTFVHNTRMVLAGDWSRYNPDKLPLYAWLSAGVIRLTGTDAIRAGQAVSWWAMTLSAPALYAALRLSLGRAAAIGGGVLFATAGVFQAEANITSSYGLFEGLMVLLAGAAALSIWTGRLWAWALTGLALGLAWLTEVKTLTVAIPVLLCMAVALLTPGRAWLGRVAGPLLLAGPAAALAGLLALTPVQYTPVERKLEIQVADTVRFLRQRGVAIPEALSIDASKAYLPPVPTRVAFNLKRFQALVYPQWRTLLALAVLGFAAPLLARGGRTLRALAESGAAQEASLARGSGTLGAAGRPGALRERLVGMGGPIFLAGIIGSIAGAFVWLFMTKYVVYALPFLLGLVVHGGWLLAGWLTPAGAPRLVTWLMGAATVASLVLSTTSLDGVKEAGKPGIDGAWLNLERSLPTRHLQEARAGRAVARWIDANTPLTDPLLLCDEANVFTFLSPARRRDLDEASGERCRASIQQPVAGTRWWVVDQRHGEGFRDLMRARPDVYVLRYSQPLDVTGDLQRLEVYQERHP